MVAYQGDEQESRQIHTDQPLQTVGGRKTILVVDHGAVCDQQSGSSRDHAVVDCCAHATCIARAWPRPDP
jgi:hypothetical protein